MLSKHHSLATSSVYSLSSPCLVHLLFASLFTGLIIAARLDDKLLLSVFFSSDVGATRKGTGTAAWTSYNPCAATHKTKQVLCHLETAGVQNAAHRVCQLET